MPMQDTPPIQWQEQNTWLHMSPSAAACTCLPETRPQFENNSMADEGYLDDIDILNDI